MDQNIIKKDVQKVHLFFVKLPCFLFNFCENLQKVKSSETPINTGITEDFFVLIIFLIYSNLCKKIRTFLKYKFILLFNN